MNKCLEREIKRNDNPLCQEVLNLLKKGKVKEAINAIPSIEQMAAQVTKYYTNIALSEEDVSLGKSIVEQVRVAIIALNCENPNDDIRKQIEQYYILTLKILAKYDEKMLFNFFEFLLEEERNSLFVEYALQIEKYIDKNKGSIGFKKQYFLYKKLYEIYKEDNNLEMVNVCISIHNLIIWLDDDFVEEHLEETAEMYGEVARIFQKVEYYEHAFKFYKKAIANYESLAKTNPIYEDKIGVLAYDCLEVERILREKDIIH